MTTNLDKNSESSNKNNAILKENSVKEIFDEEDDFDSVKKDDSRFEQIESFLDVRFDIRFNTVSRELEIKPKNKGKFEHLDDFKFNDLLRRISKAGYKVSDKSLATSLYSSFTPLYNPFVKYYETLPEWDKSDIDYIEHLASFVNAKDPYWFKIQFKKALVRTVACAIGLLPFNKHAVIFQGKQNDGKTWFIRFLMPKILENYLKENFKVDKDGLISLCQNLIINLDELDTLSKSDTDQIKSVFTTSHVKERLPYARTPMKAKRTASFWGSTNRNDFLTDETGNVRWLIFEIDGIKHDKGGVNGYEKNVDIDKVWSQAYTLLKNGFDYQLTADEVKESENNNQKFKRAYAELELLQEYFEPTDKSNGDAKFMTASKILDKISIKTMLKMNQQFFSKALRELNFERVQKRQENEKGNNVPTWGYYVIDKKNIS